MSDHHTPGSSKLTLQGLCDELVQRYEQRPSHRYCFLLGAGASKASGIPTGEELAKGWLNEIHRREDFSGGSLANWAKARFGKNFNHEQPGERYSEIYDLRFQHDRNDGYAHLEDLMEGKEPSLGYSYLGYVLSETRHNVAITTNFDNLIADSVSIYGQKFPIVLADDSLAYYATTELRRPLIAKIHGGLGFTPKNSANDISKLPNQWLPALSKVFDQYAPIVIGYAGNDGSLMDFLQTLEGKTLYWCLRTPASKLDEAIAAQPERVKRLAEKHRIHFVPVDSFDHAMASIWNALASTYPEKFPDLLAALKEKHSRRETAHESQRAALWAKPLATGMRAESASAESDIAANLGLGAGVSTRDFDSDAEADATLSLRELVSNEGDRRAEKPWWHYQQEINEIAEVDAKEVAYRKALYALPESVPLLNNLASFLRLIHGSHDEAEALYEHAIANDPTHAVALGNFGSFLTDIRARHDEAEALYERAITADPNHANNLGNFSQFLLASARRAEGLSMLSKAEREAEARPFDVGTLPTELAFYRYAHDPEHRAESLSKLKELIEADARSPSWNLSRNIEQAERDGHPNTALLKALDAVITRGEDISTLENFPERRGA